MRILLDTHVCLWWLRKDEKLTRQMEDLIAEADTVYVSAISVWETTIKAQKGKIEIDIHELIQEISKNDFHELPVSTAHSLKLLTLPHYHHDPFDRMMIAQAMSEPLQFVTADKDLKKYSELVTIV